MKKFLSLVLALVMTMSLVTISAGAKDFTDDEAINYAEAIDVISAIGVVDGYPDGSFKPQTTLNRGQAAKIISNLMLGPTTAVALKADSAPFKDVAVDNTFAGYIAYCSQAGIIDGYTDGTFKPTAPLTGYAFMKLLLGALGYDKDIEGYNVPNWSINVAKQALAIGLDNGLVDEFNGQKLVTREEACLYAFNTLKATLVDYDAKTTVSVGGAEVTIGSSKAKPLSWKNQNVQTGDKYDGNIEADEFVQFAEQYFTKLVKSGSPEAFSRPSHLWTWKGDKIGSYVDTPDATYVGKVTYADIYDDVKLTATTDDFIVYIDGVLAEDYDDEFDGTAGKGATAADILKHSTITVKSGDEDTKVGTGDGCIVEVYKTGTKDVPGVISIINTYVGQVIGVEKASGKTKASVDVGPVGSDYTTITANDSSVAVLDNETFETSDFDVDDIVIFNYSLQGTKGSIKNLAKAESVTGTLNKVASSTKKCTIGEETYKYGEMAANMFGSAQLKTEVTLYVDANGYAMYFEEGSENLKNYALVLDAGKMSAVGGASYQAELLYTDGTTELVTTDKAYGKTNGATLAAASDELVGQWVLYKTNSKGKVVLTNPTGTDKVKFATFSSSYTPVYAGSYTIPTSTKNVLTLDGSNVKINSDTKIIVKDKNNNYRVYEGVKEMPTFASGANVRYSTYTKAGSTYAKLVYLETNGAITDTSNKTIFVLSKKNPGYWDDGENLYYVFDAVVDGKIVEDGVSLDYSDANTKAAIDSVLGVTKNSALTLSTYSKDGDFYTIDMGDTTNVTVLSGAQSVEKVTGTSIDFTTGTFTLADDCVFYRVNTHGDLEQTTKSALRTKVAVSSYYSYLAYTLNSDMELTGVYWIVK